MKYENSSHEDLLQPDKQTDDISKPYIKVKWEPMAQCTVIKYQHVYGSYAFSPKKSHAHYKIASHTYHMFSNNKMKIHIQQINTLFCNCLLQSTR